MEDDGLQELAYQLELEHQAYEAEMGTCEIENKLCKLEEEEYEIEVSFCDFF